MRREGGVQEVEVLLEEVQWRARSTASQIREFEVVGSTAHHTTRCNLHDQFRPAYWHWFVGSLRSDAVSLGLETTETVAMTIAVRPIDDYRHSRVHLEATTPSTNSPEQSSNTNQIHIRQSPPNIS